MSRTAVRQGPGATRAESPGEGSGTQLPPGTIITDEPTDDEIESFREYWRREIDERRHQVVPVWVDGFEMRWFPVQCRGVPHAELWVMLVLVALYVLAVVL